MQPELIGSCETEWTDGQRREVGVWMTFRANAADLRGRGPQWVPNPRPRIATDEGDEVTPATGGALAIRRGSIFLLSDSQSAVESLVVEFERRYKLLATS
jgi:hypothetical protein